jgi:hypothetical protein
MRGFADALVRETHSGVEHLANHGWSIARRAATLRIPHFEEGGQRDETGEAAFALAALSQRTEPKQGAYRNWFQDDELTTANHFV